MSLSLSNLRIEGRYVLTSGAGDDAYARLLPQLTPDERAHADLFLLLQDRLAFAAGRVLVRKTLSQYCTEPPGGWRLVHEQHGKPAVESIPGRPDLRFNISHSTGIVAAAFSIGRDVGVDVELVEHKLDILEFARMHLLPGIETKMLEALPKGQRSTAFFALWTLREAYTKALGTGLSSPLSQFAFSLDPPAISFASQLAGSPGTWLFWQNQPTPLHLLAVAVHRELEEKLIYSQCEVNLSELFYENRVSSG